MIAGAQRVLVVGGGAIGGITAALLSGAVARIVVLGPDREATDRLRDPGLLLERRGRTTRARLEAHRTAATIEGAFDFCLVAVKAFAIEPALAPLAGRDEISTFVSLGNGLVQDRIAALVGPDRLIAGTVEWGATNLGGGRVRQTSENPIVIGELDGAIRTRTRTLETVFATFTPVRVTANITGQLWSKLLLNTALSGLSVVAGTDCADVLSRPAGRLALRRLWTEGYDLALRQRLALEPILGLDPDALAATDPAVYEPALDHLAAQSGPTRASMLQDVERGRLTEVDVINGAVVDRARMLGTRAPHNARVVDLVHAFERGELSPSPDLLEAVCAAVPAGTAPAR